MHVWSLFYACELLPCCVSVCVHLQPLCTTALSKYCMLFCICAVQPFTSMCAMWPPEAACHSFYTTFSQCIYTLWDQLSVHIYNCFDTVQNKLIQCLKFLCCPIVLADSAIWILFMLRYATYILCFYQLCFIFIRFCHFLLSFDSNFVCHVPIQVYLFLVTIFLALLLEA